MFLLGPYSSGITFATSGIAEKYNMINMSVLANADNLYTRGYKNIFSVLPPASALTTSFLEMVQTMKPAPKKFAIISPTDLFPLNVADATQKYIKDNGMEVVAYEKVAKGVKDIASPLLKIKQMKADVLIGTGYLDDGILAVRKSKDLKIDFRAMFFTTAPELPDFTKNLGKDGDYAYGASWWMKEMNYNCPVFGATKKYAELYSKKFNTTDIPYQAAGASQGGVLLQLAIEKAKSLDMDKVREAMRTYDGTTFWGRTKFDAGGRNIVGKSVTFQIQKGEIKTVFPKEAALSSPIFPTPAWSAR
jgi:branched-chain amino acid transport system substrate-binding protein